MTDTRQVDNICSVILDKSISATQQVTTLFKSVLHHILIGNVKNADLIVQRKELKVEVFSQKSTKAIINEDLRTKKSQGRVTYGNGSISMSNMNVCSASNKK